MKKYFILTAAMSLVFWGCKKETTFDGPSLNDMYGDFAIIHGLDISNRNVDFSAGQSTYFTAEFTKNVNWQLTVTGLTSGAVKQLNGFSNVLNVSNALWNGTTTHLPMFRAEDCAVALTIANVADTLRDTLTVVAPRINTGFVLADFESGMNPGWVPFIQSGANMNFSVQTGSGAAQGSRYYNMAGAVSWDWLIGMIDMPASAYGSAHMPLTSNASNLYFNGMIYKPAGVTNGLVLLQFREDDNGDGAFSEGTEDMYSIQVSLTTDGWNQVSQRYEDIPTLVNGSAAGALGNGLHEPDKLLKVSVLFLANPSSGFSQSAIDYLIFTEDAPLQP